MYFTNLRRWKDDKGKIDTYNAEGLRVENGHWKLIHAIEDRIAWGMQDQVTGVLITTATE